MFSVELITNSHRSKHRMVTKITTWLEVEEKITYIELNVNFP